MRTGSVSGWQLFVFGYFLVLLIALMGAYAYRTWVGRETIRRFEDLMRRRSSLYGMLKIMSRESAELSACSDEALSQWLAVGPSSWPQGQALRDIDTELEILEAELRTLKPPQSLAEAKEQLMTSVRRTREWVARVLTARTVGQVRTALTLTSDDDTRRRLARANDTIRQFTRNHGIKEQNSFYHDSYFYV